MKILYNIKTKRYHIYLDKGEKIKVFPKGISTRLVTE